MKRQAIYVVGGPGSGKSTLMAALVEALVPGGDVIQAEKPIPHLIHVNEHTAVSQLGRLGEFPGTDRLGYAIMPKAVSWVLSPDAPAVLVGEGDRLGSRAFLGIVRAEYDTLTVAWLNGPPALLWQRMTDRAERLGREPQNESWWRGRVTKAANVARDFEAVELAITEPTSAQVEKLLAVIL